MHCPALFDVLVLNSSGRWYLALTDIVGCTVLAHVSWGAHGWHGRQATVICWWGRDSRERWAPPEVCFVSISIRHWRWAKGQVVCTVYPNPGNRLTQNIRWPSLAPYINSSVLVCFHHFIHDTVQQLSPDPGWRLWCPMLSSKHTGLYLQINLPPSWLMILFRNPECIAGNT
jgi:hypothetical protein